MSFLDTIGRVLRGEEQEVRCDCTRCIVHRTPSLRGRQYSPQEFAALHAASLVQPEREPWPQEVRDAEQAADAALETYTALELTWSREERDAQARWVEGDRSKDRRERADAARGLLDEAGEKLSAARAHHSALCFREEARRRIEAATAAQAESEREVREKSRSRWLEILSR